MPAFFSTDRSYLPASPADSRQPEPARRPKRWAVQQARPYERDIPATQIAAVRDAWLAIQKWERQTGKVWPGRLQAQREAA